MTVARGGFPPHVLQQIRDGIDIAELVARYVSLSKTGQNFKGLCPFHSEKTPSFSVNPSRQMFYCFGCGVGGDALAFVMKKEGLGFVEAIRDLAQQAGIELPQLSGRGLNDGEKDSRKRCEELHHLAQDWFQHNLQDEGLGASARAYLAARQFHQETLNAFHVGYAPSQWDGLTRHLRQSGFSEQELVQSGLCIAKASQPSGASGGRGCYDRFRGRIMFPISNVRGQVIAFGGRVFEEGNPKYLNSPETAIFSKGRCLFGLDRALDEIGRSGNLLVTEGYCDVLALHQAGLTNAVAPLGTALTKEHVDSIRRLAKTVFLIFDGDSAGVGATLRSLDVFVNSGVEAKVVVLPPGEDPDSFIQSQGLESFVQLREQALPLVAFAVDQSLQKAQGGSVDERVRCVDEVLRILGKTQNNIEKEEYTRQIAERLGIRQERILERYPILFKERGTYKVSNRVESKKQGPVSVGRKVEVREERDLTSLFLQGTLSPEDIAMLPLDSFTVPLYRLIIERGLRQVSEKGHMILSELYAEGEGSEEESSTIAELSLIFHHFDDVREYVQGCVESIKRKQFNLSFEELIIQLRVAEREHRLEDIRELNAKIEILREQKADLAASILTRR
ncbi:MAG: DNA primase [Nitrospirae bacterium]|nr:DNA primase [Nitrospirota bacterium]